jgi:transposase
MVIIGIDPHPASLTLAVMEQTGEVLLTRTIANDGEAVPYTLELARGFPERRWAIEGAGNAYVTELVRALTTLNEHVTDVPPGLTSQYRSKRGRKKTDQVDAGIIAKAALANPALPRYTRDEANEHLKRLTRTRQRLAKHLQSERAALRALPLGSPLRQVVEGVVASLQRAIDDVTGRIEQQVQEIDPRILREHGVGPVVSGVVLAETGNVQRFRNADAFAAYCGAAPVERSSGQIKRVQLNTGGNRRLNHALHIAALARLRSHPESQAYVARKIAEGKTQRAAIRQLKALIARRLYRVLNEPNPPTPRLEPLAT